MGWDAINVLSGAPSLDASSLSDLRTARSLVTIARQTTTESTRAQAIALARALMVSASAGVGTNLVFTIGNATVMF